jgi:O-antigen ligase
LSYPVLRAAELVPTTSILQAANAVSADRAGSLQTRFYNEDQLLARAWQRPLFGWGRFGRSRVYNGWNGGDSSTTDGHWIITMGEFGVVGFVAEFGLLGFSVFRAIKALRFARTKREAEYLTALALIVAIGMVDLLPNSSISPWSWLLAGGLLGRAETLLSLTRRGRIPTETVSVAQVPVKERHSALI